MQNTAVNFDRNQPIGLTTKEASQRLDYYGRNELENKKNVSAFKILFNQFTDFLIIILMMATLFSVYMGEIVEASTILVVIIVNALLGFWQEFKTEKALEALKNLAAPHASVIRNNTQTSIPASEVVPGDILVIETGNRIAADCELLQASGLTVDESILTGESVPVLKRVRNNIYMGTTVSSGKATALVNHTGMKTEMGKIAQLIQNVDQELTPLQKKLEKMGTYLVYICLIICFFVSLIGFLKGESIYNMILSGISLAVAVIPEGLPAVVTISLAIGVQRMLKKNALIRRLPAVETLGCSTVICSDKTGTLTENKMVIKKIFCDSQIIDVSGTGFDPQGSFSFQNKTINPKENRLLIDCLVAGALCNNALLTKSKNETSRELVWSIDGDPTEGAILVAAAKAGITTHWLDNIYKRVYEIPFDCDRKMMSVVCSSNQKLIFFSKGAPDILINQCTQYQSAAGIKPMDCEYKKNLLDIVEKMGSQALRVIAIAKKILPFNSIASSNLQNAKEEQLTFLGFVGMIDPPRIEAITAINKCKTAGIRTIMITGDHKQTAGAVAQELGILGYNKNILTGNEIDKLSPSQFEKAVSQANVFARVSPRHKLQIVKSLKAKGDIVAMTGDGVNDSPALKEANIGVAMGISGTDVTKESSSMILLDDNFSTIVSAVEEGRAIYDNIRKFIRYMLSCNFGEVLTMFLGTFISSPIPLLPIQILWVNLVTDGLPGIALGLEPAEKDIMKRKPRQPNEGIFAHGLFGIIFLRGMIIGLSTLAVFMIEYFYFRTGIDMARTAAFATLVVSQLIHVFECRSEKKDIFDISLFENKYLVGSVAISMLMLLSVLYIPSLQTVFKTSFLYLTDWLFIIGFSLIGPALSSIIMSMRKSNKNI